MYLPPLGRVIEPWPTRYFHDISDETTSCFSLVMEWMFPVRSMCRVSLSDAAIGQAKSLVKRRGRVAWMGGKTRSPAFPKSSLGHAFFLRSPYLLVLVLAKGGFGRYLVLDPSLFRLIHAKNGRPLRTGGNAAAPTHRERLQQPLRSSSENTPCYVPCAAPRPFPNDSQKPLLNIGGLGACRGGNPQDGSRDPVLGRPVVGTPSLEDPREDSGSLVELLVTRGRTCFP